ncbi:HWE histidine kinase domain-containing protein [Croceibacterium ferulae]|uniref:HWE histidine kinase domain-containing protein n=1 Tax=Croceibacterium ferulae TaxID=1854641 RepID=UPI000EABDE68|nr:HWE histidine kinase domain-containing protein [Croceibacterium ferulae]
MASHGYDLSNCDREPIHKLGSIQGFGALIALNADWIVAHRSANLAAILQRPAVPAVGGRLGEHFAPAAMKLLRQAAGQLDEDQGIAEAGGGAVTDLVSRLFGVDLLGNGVLFDIALHRSGRLLIVELEPAEGGGELQYPGGLRPLMQRLGRHRDITDLCAEAARQMKVLLGFDRVMVYRFHQDGSGEVIAEAREQRLEPFLNLRYPHTDIPAQARALYLRSLLRIIADVNATPVPIEPEHAIDGGAVDLSLSTLRAVSPIHIEYLKNMGVTASLSISIVVGGKLWGLFACHHYAPRTLPYSLRTTAELFAQLFALQLELAIASGGSRMAERGRQLHDRLMTRLVGGTALVENLSTLDGVIGQVIPHDGSSAFVDGAYSCRGAAPTEAEFLAMVPALNAASSSQIIHSDALATMLPPAAAFTDRACGALVIPVSRRPRDYVVFWRRELPQVVTWAGRPEKVMEYGPNGPRLSPRRSFEAWKQSVEGHSAPWTPEELTVAEHVRVTLLEVILRMSDEQMQERARAAEQQELLIAELNHRVRNILTLIRGLVSQSRSEGTSIEQFADLVGGRIRALALAHDNITREHWSPASLHELIETEAEAYLGGKTDRITVTGPDVLVAPEAYTVLALVLHEMMTNSAKYGSLCDSAGRLAIDTRLDNVGDLQIGWRESGGPPVRPPQRRGFGSTIIERSIPYELRGAAELRHRLSGVEADFTIPGRFVQPGPSRPDMPPKDEPRLQERKGADGASPIDHVLVVEDSMIIAMDAEEALFGLGIPTVSVVSSVAGAKALLDNDRPDLALLDFNLGAESSEPIARALDEMGVPYWFVTGYGDAIAQLGETAARGILQKPYSTADLAGILEQMRGG